ncbi:peptidoglycan recognition family protein [Natronococcus sp. A-GB1]|uniref:peptidoglycan recognition protein family protein n=1 Tax=Natronococcus sp. A-GB1 TaxID=3037648 RepID=UPI00241F5281|nr:peptidoglycan recognition family protein [Natronococcus sp. A-GB1]MDG5758751.1 peptidoglycan recognition family protein [Natronococcus sp. A-GB1]
MCRYHHSDEATEPTDDYDDRLTAGGCGAGDGSRDSTDSTGSRRSLLKKTAVSGLVVTGIGSGASVPVSAHHRDDHPSDQYVSAHSSNYTSASRGAADINWIVVHCAVTTYQGCIDYFQRDNDRNVSAHYVVSNYDHTSGAPGHCTQMVNHADIAHHARGSNANSIGIEHEWHEDYGNYFTDECYRTSADLVRYLADHYDVPTDFYDHPSAMCEHPGGIITHRHAPQDYTSNGTCKDMPAKSCPGPDWENDRYRSFLDGDDGGGGGHTFEDGDWIQTTVDLNGRDGPGLDYDTKRTYPEGTEGEIMNGPEDNDGYTWWGIHFPSYSEWVWCAERYLEHA